MTCLSVSPARAMAAGARGGQTSGDPPAGGGGGGGGVTGVELGRHPPTVCRGAFSKCGGHKSRLPPPDGFTRIQKSTDLLQIGRLWSLFLAPSATFRTTCVSNVSSGKCCQSWGYFFLSFLMFPCDIIGGAQEFWKLPTQTWHF